jgi:hypothetical protein
VSGLALHLRSRRIPGALAVAGGCVALMWTLWSVFSDTREVGLQLVILTVLLLVVALTATLGGADDELEATAAFSWLPRRTAHLVAAFVILVVLLGVTHATGARFGPAGLVVRDVAGLLGLTALSAAVIGTARSWFVPLGWTLAAVLFPQPETLAGRILTWQSEEPASIAAGVTAGLLALGGLVAYAVAGPARKTPAEAAQR